MNNIKIYENTFIKGNIDVLNTAHVNNELVSNNLKIKEILNVKNFIYIDQNLNINQNLKTTNIKNNSLLNIKENTFIEDTLNTDSSLECENIDSKNFILQLNKKDKNYLFDNNVLIYNTTNIENYGRLSNLFLSKDLLSKNLDSINTNLNIINTQNASILNGETKKKCVYK